MPIVHVGLMPPINSMDDLRATIESSLAPINHAIVAESPVGVGVRISQALLNDPELSAESLESLLTQHGLYLAGISAVGITGGLKEHVHEPDWRSEERLSFMFPAANLARDLATPEREIGISTNALSYRSWIDIDFPGNWAALTLNVVRMVQHLVSIRDTTGITIHMDIEAEPGSVLRDTADIVKFYSNWLLPRGAAMLSDRMLISDGTAAEAILRHVRLALDTAHAAVVRDEAVPSLDALAHYGIGIGRIQASSALEVTVPAKMIDQMELAHHLGNLVNPRLLQQVVATRDGEIVRRYDDLPDAIAAIADSDGEVWRIHTHAPLLDDRYGFFSSTRHEAAAWVREIVGRGIGADMIELRSATWDVIPNDDRAPLDEMIQRESQWLRTQMGS